MPCADVTLVLAELDAHCQEKLGRLKAPKEYHLLPELPRTGIGKVHKARLRAQLKGTGH